MLEHTTPQRPPATGTAAPHGPERAGRARVERLEYGKFCVSPTGRIEDMAEYRQLGWTEEFPPWLVNSCMPSVIGISSDVSAFDTTPGGPDYGTVLRPVVPAGQPPVSVMCRVRTRPEGGEDKEGRRYTVARYIVSRAAELDPRELLAAMESEKLQGVTHEDLTPRLSPLWAEPRPLPDDGALPAFLRDALVYVLSGVPVAVTEAYGEDGEGMKSCEAQFFAWVAAIWHALPRGLRPYLSAGWGVGGQLSGSLAVTYATRPSDTCATFGHRSGLWAAPAKVIVREGGEMRKKDLSSEPYRLTAGRVYVERVLGWAPGARPRLAELRAAADAWPLSDRLPVRGFRQLPDWPDAETARLFRYPGLRRFDDDRAEDICSWIEGGVIGDGAAPSPDARGLLYPENRLRVFTRAVAAQGGPEGRARGDAVVWASLKGERAPDFVEHVRVESRAGGAGATRARLMLALRERAVADALHWLLKAAPHGAADDLPGEAEAILYELLGADESLSHAGNLSLHLHLLRHPRRPGPYLGWLRAQPFGLSLTLLTTRDLEGVADCAYILKLTDAPPAKALLNLAQDQLPTAEDHAALAALDVRDKLKFTATLLRRWFLLRNKTTQRGTVRKRRELILRWLDGLPLPGETEDALLRLWRGQPLTRHHLHAIMDDVEGLIVPPSPLPLIADLVRHNFYEFAERIGGAPEAWAPVASYMLPEVAYALRMRREPSEEGEARAAGMADAREVRMRTAQADDLIMFWTNEGRRELRRVAHLLWRWAAEALPTSAGHTTAADLCRYLDRAELPSELKRPAEETLDALLLLAEVSGKDKELLPEGRRLWEQSKRGWQLRLLLEMFPEEDLEPTLRQLGRLVSQQKWLRTHLRRTTIHPDRRERCALAAVSFLGLTFPGTGEFPWYKELSSETVLWAAYRGIPFKHQGGLAEALDAYGADLRERAELCLKYVRSYKHDGDSYKEALSRALADFLLPQFGNAGLHTKEMASALQRGEQGGWFGGGILLLGRSSSRRPNYDAALDGVVDEVIMGLDGKEIERAIKAFRQKYR